MSFLQRRQFLESAAAAAGALAAFRSLPDQSRDPAAGPAPGAAAGGLPAGWRSMRKLDVHGHLSGTQGLHWSRPADLVRACDQLGIEKICCSTPIPGGELVSPSIVRECNDGVLEGMRQFPSRILGYCFVQPGNGRAALDEIDRCLDAGMIGVKLYNQFKYSDPIVFPVAEKCIARGVPILGHSSHATDPVFREAQPNASTGRDFCALARRYPELLLIMAHIDGGGDTEYGIKLLRDCPTVYLDTSGSVMNDLTIELAVRELGHERIVFGTDTTMESGVGKILSADLTGEQRQSIFWRNLQGILDRRLA
jgi:uncharacterized protein